MVAGDYRKAVFTQDARGPDKAGHVRFQRYFELGPARAELSRCHVRGGVRSSLTELQPAVPAD